MSSTSRLALLTAAALVGATYVRADEPVRSAPRAADEVAQAKKKEPPKVDGKKKEPKKDGKDKDGKKDAEAKDVVIHVNGYGPYGIAYGYWPGPVLPGMWGGVWGGL